MRFCTKCGSEVGPDGAFCESCGTPVQAPGPTGGTPTQPSAPPAPGVAVPPMAGPGITPGGPVYGPPAASMPPGSYPGRSGGKGGKIALVMVLGVALIGAVLVLLLGFAVGPKWFVSSNSGGGGGSGNGGGGGSGPEKTVNTLLASMENKDARAFLSTLSPASKRYLEDVMGVYVSDLEAIVDDYIFSYQSLRFDDVKYKTDITGDRATVTVVAGKVTAVDEYGNKTTEDAKDSDEPTQFVLVKENGTWYIIFEQTFQ